MTRPAGAFASTEWLGRWCRSCTLFGVLQLSFAKRLRKVDCCITLKALKQATNRSNTMWNNLQAAIELFTRLQANFGLSAVEDATDVFVECNINRPTLFAALGIDESAALEVA